MRYYCTKTGKRYESPPLLIVGGVTSSLAAVTEYGFFASMVHVDDGGPIPLNRQFIVAKTVPKGWTGETITADKFAETMDKRLVKPKAQLKLSATASKPSMTSAERIGGRLSMGCCGGK